MLKLSNLETRFARKFSRKEETKVSEKRSLRALSPCDLYLFLTAIQIAQGGKVNNKFNNWALGPVGRGGEMIAFSNKEMQVSISVEDAILRVTVRDFYNRVTYTVVRTSTGVIGKFRPLLVHGKPPFVDHLEVAGSYYMGMTETEKMLQLLRRAVSYREKAFPEGYLTYWNQTIEVVRAVENGEVTYTLSTFPTAKLKVAVVMREWHSVAATRSGAMFVFLPRKRTTVLVANTLLGAVLETELGWKITNRYHDACEVLPVGLTEQEALEKICDLLGGMVEIDPLLSGEYPASSSLTMDDVTLKFGDFEFPAFKTFDAGEVTAVCECRSVVNREEFVIGSGSATMGGAPIIRGPLARACRTHHERCGKKIELIFTDSAKKLGIVCGYSDLLGIYPLAITDQELLRECADKQRILEKAFREYWKI